MKWKDEKKIYEQMNAIKPKKKRCQPSYELILLNYKWIISTVNQMSHWVRVCVRVCVYHFSTWNWNWKLIYEQHEIRCSQNRRRRQDVVCNKIEIAILPMLQHTHRERGVNTKFITYRDRKPCQRMYHDRWTQIFTTHVWVYVTNGHSKNDKWPNRSIKAKYTSSKP